MRRSFGVWLLAVALPAAAAGQTTTTQATYYPVTTRGFMTLDIGLQAASDTSTSTGTFDVYDETGSFESQQDHGTGFLFSIGGIARVRGALGAGATFSYVRSGQDARVTVNAPHPLIYGAPRRVTSEEDGGTHSESALHFHAAWMVTVSEQLEVAVSAGPSLFFVSHDYVSGTGFEETGAPFTTITVADVQRDNADDTAFGFNVGLDVQYYLTDTIGAGAFVRYAAANANVDLGPGGKQEVDAGGFQLGGGLRVRF